MNPKGFIRSAAASIAPAGIPGGGALGFAAGANASTATPEQMTRQHMAAVRADAHRAAVQTGPRDGGAAAAAGAAEVADGPGRPQP